MHYAGSLYILQFVFEPTKAIKFDYFEEKFYGFEWKREKL
jgi:hypothetical protein